MNVAFIYTFFFLILNFFKIPYKINIILCIFAVLAYVLMTGLGASVVRAALMLLFVLVGKLINRDAHSISLLSFVALLMLVYNPMYLNDDTLSHSKQIQNSQLDYRFGYDSDYCSALGNPGSDFLF